MPDVTKLKLANGTTAYIKDTVSTAEDIKVNSEEEAHTISEALSDINDAIDDINTYHNRFNSPTTIPSGSFNDFTTSGMYSLNDMSQYTDGPSEGNWKYGTLLIIGRQQILFCKAEFEKAIYVRVWANYYSPWMKLSET